MDVWMWSRFCREWWHPMWETWACSGLDHCLRIYVLLLIRTQAFRSTSGERMRWKGSYLVQASIWNILINRATSTMFKPCPMDICGIWLHQVQANRRGGGGWRKYGRRRVKREWVRQWKRKRERRGGGGEGSIVIWKGSGGECVVELSFCCSPETYEWLTTSRLCCKCPTQLSQTNGPGLSVALPSTLLTRTPSHPQRDTYTYTHTCMHLLATLVSSIHTDWSPIIPQVKSGIL